MNIDMDHKYQTRDGRAVRLLCVDGPGCQPIVGIVDGADSVDTWDARGAWLDRPGPSDWDLVPVTEKHEGWCVWYSKPYIFETREDAKHQVKVENSSSQRIVAHVTWED